MKHKKSQAAMEQPFGLGTSSASQNPGEIHARQVSLCSNRRGQAAMEFLMTYGWALLVVIIVIAALVFFGLLDPSNLLPDKVDLGPGLTAIASKVDEGGITLILQNGLGKSLYDFSLKAGDCEFQYPSYPIGVFSSGEKAVIYLYCGGTIPPDGKFMTDIEATYKVKVSGMDTKLEHTKQGMLRLSVNEGETCIPGGEMIGSGEQGDPFQVCDCKMLQEIGSSSTNLAAYYIVTEDIDCTMTNPNTEYGEYLVDRWSDPWGDEKGFDPIGTQGDGFLGEFDGQGHVITGLYIDRSAEDDVGLFGYVGDGTGAGLIKNIGLENVIITGNFDIGGLVGFNDGSITNSYFTGVVSGNFDIGGLVGSNNGDIENSYSTGEIWGDEVIGGLVGYNNMWGSIKNSYSTGDVSGNDLVGGLVGLNDGGSITNCYFTGINNNLGDWVSPDSVFYDNTHDVYDTTAPQWDFTTIWKTTSTYPVLAWQD